jgi:hypothetical protein
MNAKVEALKLALAGRKHGAKKSFKKKKKQPVEQAPTSFYEKAKTRGAA